MLKYMEEQCNHFGHVCLCCVYIHVSFSERNGMQNKTKKSYLSRPVFIRIPFNYVNEYE